MADHATLILFRSGCGDLESAATLLADRGMSVKRVSRELGNELIVGYRRGPRLRVAFLCESYVQEEASAIGEGTPHAAEMTLCDVRYEILIDDLDGVLDEINTLIEVQATLPDATGGFLFNTWNGELAGPESNRAEPGPAADRPRA
jgi:hypothetical protein